MIYHIDSHRGPEKAAEGAKKGVKVRRTGWLTWADTPMSERMVDFTAPMYSDGGATTTSTSFASLAEFKMPTSFCTRGKRGEGRHQLAINGLGCARQGADDGLWTCNHITIHR